MDGPEHQHGVYLFEQCRLNVIGRTLSRNGTLLPLGTRLFDTLFYLVQNPGRIIEREELTAAVWPTRTVDETSLPKAISSLRALLKAGGIAEDIILTVPGRGYRFGARVVFEALPDPVGATATLPDHAPGDARGGAARWARPGAARVFGFGLCAIVLALLWRSLPASRPAANVADNVPAAPPHSVAVLPFVNTSGEPAQEYLSDGMSEELINALGRVASLRVAARNSSFAFKGKPAPIREIAQHLNVGDVLEGSMQRVGTRLHVTVQLVDGSTGFQIWSRHYDRDKSDILAVEGQIAEEVITSVKGVLLDADLAKLALGGTNNPQAFDAYLSGMSAMGATSGAADRRAIDAFRQAIMIDPEYAEAYVQRARAGVLMAVSGGASSTTQAAAMLETARLDAERAVLIAPKLGAAHAVLGLVLKFQLNQLGRAADEYRQAVELSPEDASSAISYALFEAELGHMAQALAAAQHAVALDPLQPMYHRILAEIFIDARRYGDASAALRRAQNLQPADARSDRIISGMIEIAQGDMAAAETSCRQDQDFYALACQAIADRALGRPDEANAVLARLRASVGDQGAFIFAGIYACWGQQADALIWLQRAYELRDPGLIEIRVDPRLDKVRGTPAYNELVQRLGFPP